MNNPQQNSVRSVALRLKWWQVALIAVGVSLLGKLSTGSTRKSEQKLYNIKLDQAPWAPPAWVFGVAWPLNNFFVLMALRSLLAREESTEKKNLLLLQAGIWAIFFSFGLIYFRKKSPVLAAAWTMTDAALSLSSFVIARRIDPRLANLYLPLLLWTSYASTVADYQALKNPDPVLHIDAPVQ